MARTARRVLPVRRVRRVRLVLRVRGARVDQAAARPGGLVLLDGNGNEVTGLQPGIDPRFVISGTLNMSPTEQKIVTGGNIGSQDGFVRYVNDALWVMKRDGTYAPTGQFAGNVFFKSLDCTGTMYLPAYTAGSFVQTTLIDSRDSGVSPERDYYRQTGGTETVTAGDSWSSYYSFANYSGACGTGTVPSTGTVVQAYTRTTSDTFPTPPAASTPPFSWSAG